MENQKKSTTYSMSLASSLLAMILIIAILYYTSSVVLPLLFSILISIMLYPLARLFERLRLGKAFSAILSVIVAIVIMSGLGWFIVYESIVIGRDASAITGKVMSVLENSEAWLQNTFGIERNQVMAQLREQGDKAMDNVGGMLSSTFGSIGSMLAATVLVPLFTFFLLYYRVFFREFFFKAFHSVPKQKVHDTLDRIYDVVQSYLLGLITVMGIVAVLNTIGLMILGIDYAWFFGTLASLLMLLPYIGIAIGSILPALFALATKDSAWYAIGVVAWFQVVQFLEGNIITPNIVGSKVSINPLMAIIAILLGGMIFGLAGLILALPMVATIKVIFDAIPSMEAYGFLIGEPEKMHLQRNSTQQLLMKWGIVREPKVKKKKVIIETEVAEVEVDKRKEITEQSQVNTVAVERKVGNPKQDFPKSDDLDSDPNSQK
ncbi:AI-2E family transporter [Sphingobacterium sp. lm-10]|uniref:AI-2E family transporter n=1 Tax=Sphingobacterium sp. lm-10 TaxID=2944904 RepID=UPI002020FFDB|nr:AI-2E family transporter [Sphingobacterium sp. lm-10]MCL7989244.1 AI-2E family transporter [Sphingobacterium sp. lm-10]